MNVCLYLFLPTLTDLLYRCPCVDDAACAAWDQFSTCNGTCQCIDNMIFDYNTLSCVQGERCILF